MPAHAPSPGLIDRLRHWISPESGALKVGMPLPGLSVIDDLGNQVRLCDMAAGWTLIYFFPRADTPGCTAQACSLRDAYTQLLDRGVKVFGVSFDDCTALRRFRENHALPFALLSDSDGALADAFHVPHLAGLAKRQAFLFKDGALAWRDTHASTDRQAADVLAILAENAAARRD
jgi:peroxiredoxin Q/BCP